MGVIYSITNPKGKVYVGKTYNLKRRVAAHKCRSKKDRRAIILCNSIHKYGWDNHLLQVIEEVEDDRMNEREIFWIAILKTYCYENKMGMNMTLGGDGQRYSWKHDKERVEKARIRATGENGIFYGRKHTEENKRIIGDKARKRNLESGRTIPKWGVEKGRLLCSKKVAAYNLKGKFLAAFSSCGEANKHFDICDSSCVARWEQAHTHGIIFRYYENEYLESISVAGINFEKNNRPIIQLNKDKEIIDTFANAKEAQEKTGVPHGNITRGARESRGLRSGHFFLYKDETILSTINNN